MVLLRLPEAADLLPWLPLPALPVQLVMVPQVLRLLVPLALKSAPLALEQAAEVVMATIQPSVLLVLPAIMLTVPTPPLELLPLVLPVWLLGLPTLAQQPAKLAVLLSLTVLLVHGVELVPLATVDTLLTRKLVNASVLNSELDLPLLVWLFFPLFFKTPLKSSLFCLFPNLRYVPQFYTTKKVISLSELIRLQDCHGLESHLNK